MLENNIKNQIWEDVLIELIFFCVKRHTYLEISWFVFIYKTIKVPDQFVHENKHCYESQTVTKKNLNLVVFRFFVR